MSRSSRDKYVPVELDEWMTSKIRGSVSGQGPERYGISLDGKQYALDKQERRRILKERLGSIIAHVRFPVRLAPDLGEHAIDLMSGKAPLVWIQGQNCTGCTCALMDSDYFNPVDLGYEKISLMYQPDLMAATGDMATDQLEQVEEASKGRYIIVVEGSIPVGEDSHFCTFGVGNGVKSLMGNQVPDEKPIQDWLKELVPDAAAVIAVGNCASYGGISRTIANITGATPVPDVIRELDPGKPVINIAGCPPHPDWIVGTIGRVLLWITGDRERPELDELGRVKKYYASTIHELCERLPSFKEKRFLEDWNDIRVDDDRCLLKFGCRGPKTHGDCPKRAWNSRTKWCVGANSPCNGCTEPGFIDRLSHHMMNMSQD